MDAEILREAWQRQGLAGTTVPPLDAEGFAEVEQLAEGDSEFLNDLLSTYIEQATLLLGQAQSDLRAGSHRSSGPHHSHPGRQQPQHRRPLPRASLHRHRA